MSKNKLLISICSVVLSYVFISGCTSSPAKDGYLEFTMNDETQRFSEVEFKVGVSGGFAKAKPKIEKISKGEERKFDYLISSIPSDEPKDNSVSIYWRQSASDPESPLKSPLYDLQTRPSTRVLISTKEWTLRVPLPRVRGVSPSYWFEFTELTENRARGNFGGSFFHISKIDGVGPTYFDKQLYEITDGTFDVPYSKFFKY